MQRLRVTTKASQGDYEIKIGSDLLGKLGADARTWLGKDSQLIAVISNPTVFELYGTQTLRSLKASGFKVFPWLVKDGERAKSLNTIHAALNVLSNERFGRGDAILALGGGVIGDLAGFTAAIYLRGIPFIQVPTTLLAQIDSSVGGKTGVNLPHGKNLVGAFHQPAGVLTDVRTLQTLPRRELVAGLCECVKQGVLSGKKLFDQTVKVLDGLASMKPELMTSEFEQLVAAQCKFKAGIVKGDELESRNRNDPRSRRILNFGHTAGHAFEVVTKYRRFRHGEAVGLGMLVAGELSKNLGMLSPDELKLLAEAVGSCGRLPRADDLDEELILNAITHDKKSVAGTVQWVLIEGIGRPRIVSGKEITPALLRQSLRLAVRTAAL